MLEAVLKKDYPEDFKRIIAITYRFSAGWRRVHNPVTGHDVADNLTTTEFATAMLAARGWTNQEIADHMGISPNTVKQYISTTLQKLNIRQRQMEQDRGGGNGKKGGRPQLGRHALIRILQRVPHLRQGVPRPLDLPDGEVGIGVDQTGRQPQGEVRIGEIELRCPGGLLRLAAEIVVLGPGNIPQAHVLDPLNARQTLPRRERRIQEGHRDQMGGRNTGSRLRHRLLWLGRFSPPSRVLRLLGVSRDGPDTTEFFRTLDASACTILLGEPLGDLPFLGCFMYGNILHSILPSVKHVHLTGSHYMRFSASFQGFTTGAAGSNVLLLEENWWVLAGFFSDLWYAMVNAQMWKA